MAILLDSRLQTPDSGLQTPDSGLRTPDSRLQTSDAEGDADMATVIELPIETYASEVEPDWCAGCGDFGVLRALQIAAGRLGINPKDLMIVSGIGCSSNLPGFIHSYGVHSLHGRAVPIATGIKLANHDLNVVITGGD